MKFLKVRTYIISTLIIAVFLLLSAFDFTANEFTGYKYVGVTKCVGACHKTESQGRQFEIWKNSEHANAWETLGTEEADKIAREKGFNPPATDVPECVRCHVLGKIINPEELRNTFDKTEGVQCESCHGPGSDYMKMSIMKDSPKSIENGLLVYEHYEELCIKCHNEESPTFKGFEFDSYWSKISHQKP
ncbi:MAG: cytochrome C554 [Ignavibacteria bacterium]|nr:cytochrome C554 [Ignavibacteria bacterium]